MNNMNIQELDFRLLQCFATLLSERSVSRAAARLDLSQPAMSHALGRLRRLFDDPLLLKGHGHMTPTARALELEVEVRALLAGAERLVSRPAEFVAATTRTRFGLMTASTLYGAAAFMVSRKKLRFMTTRFSLTDRSS